MLSSTACPIIHDAISEELTRQEIKGRREAHQARRLRLLQAAHVGREDDGRGQHRPRRKLCGVLVLLHCDATTGVSWIIASVASSGNALPAPFLPLPKLQVFSMSPERRNET